MHLLFASLRINQRLERDARAVALGIAVQRIDFVDGEFNFRMEAPNPAQLPGTLRAAFHHATRSDRDQVIELTRDANGSYRGNIVSLDSGRWHVEISAADWRVVTSYRMP